MQRIVLAALLLSVAVAACARIEIEEKFHQNIAATNKTQFIVDNMNGGIETEPSTTDTISIDVIKKVVGDSRETCADIMKKLKVIVIEEKGVATVRVSRVSTRNHNYAVHFKIKLPPRLEARLETTNGSISVSEHNADLRAETTNGGIHIQDCVGNVVAQTTNGGVAVSGKMRETAVRTTNGGIDLEVDLQTNGKLEASTVNGGIDVVIPKDVSAKLVAETVNGSVRCRDFPVQISKRRTLGTGTLGSGSGTISLETVNGSISIKAK